MAGTKISTEGLPGFVTNTILSASSNFQQSLEGVVVSGMTDRALCYVRENEGTYRFFDDSLAAHAPPAVVRPAELSATEPGRWILEAGGNEVVVTSQADFPEPVAGVIELESNVTYIIVGEVSIDADVRIRFAAGACLVGRGRHCDSLIGNSSVGAFVFANAGIAIHISNLTVVNNGTSVVIDHDGNSLVGIELLNVIVDGGGNGPGVTVTNETIVKFDNVNIVNVVGTNLVLAGAIVDVDITGPSVFDVESIGIDITASITGTFRPNARFQLNGAGDIGIRVAAGAIVTVFVGDAADFIGAGTGLSVDGTIVSITLDGASFSVSTAIDLNATAVISGGLTLSGSLINVTVGNVGIDLDAAATIAGAVVVGNVFRGTGTFLVGVAIDTDGWEFTSNVGIEDTAAGGGLSLTAALAIVAGDLGAQVAANVAAESGNLLFSVVNGQVVYNGHKRIRAEITALISATAAGLVVNAQIEVNGVPVSRPGTANIGATRTLLAVKAVVILNQGDTIDVNVDAALTSLEQYQLMAGAAA